LPILAGAVTWAAATGTEPEVRFDPHASPVPIDGHHPDQIGTH
jgi:hypothetical protein